MAGHWRERVSKENFALSTVDSLPFNSADALTSSLRERSLSPFPRRSGGTSNVYRSKVRSSNAWEQFQVGHNPISGYSVRWSQSAAGLPFTRHRMESHSQAAFPRAQRFEKAELTSRYNGEFGLTFKSVPVQPQSASISSLDAKQPMPERLLPERAAGKKPFTKYLDEHIRSSHLLPRYGLTWAP